MRGWALYQGMGDGRWDASRRYEAVAVITAGPNNGATGRYRSSSMTRTVDPFARNYTYFRRSIVFALVAMLDKMIEQDVTIAVVPGLSTGLYAGGHKERVNSPGEFMRIIDEALNHGGVDRRSRFQTVCYAHY